MPLKSFLEKKHPGEIKKSLEPLVLIQLVTRVELPILKKCG
jgi:hypothetical protein